VTEVEAGTWQAVTTSDQVTDQPMQVWLAGRPWVLVRLAGRLVGFADRCPHRLAPLSAGRSVGDALECGYHGWRFGPSGEAVSIPSLGGGARLPPRACLQVLPVRDHDGTVLALPPPAAPPATVAS
jgi:phenylpropionate dioxygenase-like ring-hydroxylating dioxygenase large terminal subunit